MLIPIYCIVWEVNPLSQVTSFHGSHSLRFSKGNLTLKRFQRPFCLQRFISILYRNSHTIQHSVRKHNANMASTHIHTWWVFTNICKAFLKLFYFTVNWLNYVQVTQKRVKDHRTPEFSKGVCRKETRQMERCSTL